MVSTVLQVLISVKAELEEKFTEEEIASLRTQEGKEAHQEALKEIYDKKCQEVISKGNQDGGLGAVAGYFGGTHISFEEAEDWNWLGFGATKPDQIRENVLSWNRRDSMEFINLLGEFEKLAAQQGFKTLSEMFTAQIGEDGRIGGGIFWHPTTNRELRRTLACVDGVLRYDNYRIVFNKESTIFGDIYSIDSYVTADTMAHAAEHPEDFLLLGVWRAMEADHSEDTGQKNREKEKRKRCQSKQKERKDTRSSVNVRPMRKVRLLLVKKIGKKRGEKNARASRKNRRIPSHR